MSTVSLSVIIPALNEEANLQATVDTVFAALAGTVPDHEVIVVNDGSTDRTGQIAEALARRHGRLLVLHNELNAGVGYSYARGAALASKQAAVFVPGDDGWPENSLREVFSRIGSADIVVTYSTNPRVRSRSRRLVSWLYTAALNLLFGHRLRYYNGLAVYPAAFLRGQPVTTGGFAFMAELLLKALAAGLSYTEVGVPIEERRAGRSKALHPGNVISVITAVGRLYWGLRLSRWSAGAGRTPAGCDGRR